MSLHSSFGYDSLRSVIFAKAIKVKINLIIIEIKNEHYLSETSSDIKSNISFDSENMCLKRNALKDLLNPK